MLTKLKSFEAAGYTIMEDGTILNPKGVRLKPSQSGRKLKYLYVSWRHQGRRVTELVHRLVAKKYIPNPHGLPEVHHKDFNPLNCHKDNLEWTDGKKPIASIAIHVWRLHLHEVLLWCHPMGLSMMCLMFVNSAVNMTSTHRVYLRCLVVNVNHIKGGLFTGHYRRDNLLGRK